MSTYNGHKNYDYWNVSLWINNDHGLYVAAKEDVRRTKTRTAAAALFIDNMKALGVTKTPDGSAYTVDRVRRAMEGM